ncbi:Lanthionine synthetase C-like protein [Paenibacillus tianmuensis]|uniref:Lanthionine synthetase C-like protein n=1 Tax=Paenibacillus tianmuensis TaxID=624147 RepID=A0A1G4QLQ8_9BACL|nr:Lanthionine synthetase C-like protein [Paenibacillus tianmuensis]
MTENCTVSTLWSPLHGEIRCRVQQVLCDIAQRYKDPTQVRKLVLKALSNEVNGSQTTQWSSISLGSGFTGICLLIAQLDQLFPDEGGDFVGHSYLQEIRLAIEKNGFHRLSLYSGIAGVLIGVRALSRKGVIKECLIN